ncbi:MAG: DNA repair protein RecN [Verrucomicrobiota bacterium]
MPATLSSLRIRNLALVEDLEWRMGPGFTAVTGETGSGKSIILGALKLILGERAEKSLLRTGAETCSVEAVFEMESLAALNPWLEEQGVEPCEGRELILKRTFTRSGANRQFINASPTTLAVLEKLGNTLVDLHGPHDHQSLLSVEAQLALLDAFAGSGAALGAYTRHYQALLALTAEHEALSTNESALERELDLLRHQASEIEAAELRAEEQEALDARYRVASNSRRLVELSTQIVRRLSDADDALLPGLEELTRLFRELEKLDPTAAPLAQAHSQALAGLEETARELERYAERLDLDPAQLAALEERVTLLETLKRKYGPSLADVIAFGEEAAARLRKIESRSGELERLAREIDTTRTQLLADGKKLSGLRQAAAPKLADDVCRQLRDLGFKKSGFEIALAACEKPGPHGLESAEFLFAPNPGEPLKPLKAIASSGEISRVMLAVKSSLAAQDTVGLLVFDEIDANVGGEIAHTVGAKMRSLGEGRQVLCITHLPQVAAAAQAQCVVTKDFTGGRTHSHLAAVEGKARVEEIARMLGGKSESALAHAKELLKGQAK